MKDLLLDTTILDPFQRTNLALDLLVQNCLSASPPDGYPRKALLKEYMTVRFTSYRMAGHTTSALAVASRYFRNPAFICFLQSQTHGILKMFEDIQENANNKGNRTIALASHKNFERKLREADSDCMVLEQASMLSRSRTEVLYDLASGFKSLRCIIMLQ